MSEKLVKRLPGLAILLIVLVYLATDFSYHNWTRDKGPERGVIKWDVISYYAYLPATFIYKDIGLDFVSEKEFKNDNKFWFQKTETGKNIIITSMGVSYLYAPFFFIAHVLAPVFDEPQDGFSSIYQFFLVFSSLFYVIIALVFLKKILLRFFSRQVTALSLLGVALGTNLYFYGTHEAAMSHAYSFSLIAFFIWLVIRWYESPVWGRTALLGLLYGLIVLIRPSNVLLLVILVLWGVTGWKDLVQRLLFLLRKFPKVLLMVICFIIPWIPQFLYWKEMTGSFMYNSYDQVGSAFYFDYPHIFHFLLSFRSGWFVYTPLMLLACIGFMPMFTKLKGAFYSLLLYLVLMIYLLSSWWSWWYGGSFGIRSMVDIYAVMAIPLAVFITWSLGRNKMWKYLGISFVGLLILLNVFQTWQYSKGLIHWVGMTRETYQLTFLRTNDPYGYWQNLAMPDFELARKGIYVSYWTGENYDELKAMDTDDAMHKIESEVRGDRRLMRDIRKHSGRTDTPADSAVIMVVERIYSVKSAE